MTDREVFRKNLNYYLSETGTLQKDLAEYVGAKTTTVSGWTRGISYPRADAMEKIADFFSIPLSKLVMAHDDDQDDEEEQLLRLFRALSSNGKRLMLERAQELVILYGKKSDNVPTYEVKKG